MFEPTRRLLAVPLVRALALECFRIEEEMGAKFLRGVRMSLLAARGTCKLNVWPTLLSIHAPVLDPPNRYTWKPISFFNPPNPNTNL